MRKNFEIKTSVDVARLMCYLILDLGIDINPDDPIADYRSRDTNEPTFSADDAAYYQELIDKSREVTEKEGTNIYDICMRVLGLFHYCDKNPTMTFMYDNGTLWKQANGGTEFCLFRKVHGGTHDDPALLYSLTDASVYFHNEETDTMENIDNPAGIDAYADKRGEFYVRAEDYDNAYQQLYEHDREMETEE